MLVCNLVNKAPSHLPLPNLFLSRLSSCKGAKQSNGIQDSDEKEQAFTCLQANDLRLEISQLLI